MRFGMMSLMNVRRIEAKVLIEGLKLMELEGDEDNLDDNGEVGNRDEYELKDSSMQIQNALHSMVMTQ
jgi:hypothetical protein